jgi:hypothetical protein
MGIFFLIHPVNMACEFVEHPSVRAVVLGLFCLIRAVPLGGI